VALLVSAAAARGQNVPGAASTPAPAPAQPQSPEDALGRSTPRGTVLGFLSAARRGDNALARQYLGTRSNGAAGEELARELFVVLDARLPARLTQVSDAPEGTRDNPLEPDVEVVGTVGGRNGEVDVILERVRSAKTGPIWVFSNRTLDAVPALYADVDSARQRRLRPQFLERRLGNIPLFEAVSVVLGLLLLYFVTVVLSRALTPLVALIWRKLLRKRSGPPADVLPASARMLLMSVVAHWLSAIVPLSLLVRQFLGNITTLMIIAAAAWLLIFVNGELERHLLRRVPRLNSAGAISLLRVGRRIVDVLVVFAALLATLQHFGVDATPVLAGLGVGGLAVALAAQKTLENVIAGASLIFDQAVRVGDFLRVGEIQGTVDAIGLRSTRIRTLDRTIVSVPNGQIANMSLETLSARDKFWFHPIVGVRYETTDDQLRAVLDGIRELLAQHPAVDTQSIRVRFLRLGPFSLDVDVFAYLFARDYNGFLEIQEQLLFGVTTVVRESGTGIAFPSQTMYVSNAHDSFARDALSLKP
jgi:MscS family membrane protein